MKRLTLVLVFAGLLLSATPVAAAKPSSEPFLLPERIEDTSCGFLVVVTFPAQQEAIRTFFSRDGEPVRQIISGRLAVTFTNLVSGATLTLNISGPSHIDLLTGDYFQEGRIGGPVGQLSGLNSLSGRLNLTTGEMQGHLVPLCPLLA